MGLIRLTFALFRCNASRLLDGEPGQFSQYKHDMEVHSGLFVVFYFYCFYCFLSQESKNTVIGIQPQEQKGDFIFSTFLAFRYQSLHVVRESDLLYKVSTSPPPPAASVHLL